jgi:Cytochrome b(C-terminal)/b6/petD.
VAGVPWYLLVFDGLSQAGRSPGGGVALGVAALVLLGALPWLDRGTVASGRYRPIYAAFVLLFALDVTVLGVATAAGSTGVMIAATIWVFVHFLVVTPLVTLLEVPRPIPGQPA